MKGQAGQDVSSESRRKAVRWKLHLSLLRRICIVTIVTLARKSVGCEAMAYRQWLRTDIVEIMRVYSVTVGREMSP